MSRDKLWPEGYVPEGYVPEGCVLDVNAELYVDTLEGEIDEVELEKLRPLRQGLQKSDDVTVPESGAYYDALEARIMASLDAAIDAGDVKDRSVHVASQEAAVGHKPKPTLKLPLKNKKVQKPETQKSDTPQGLVAQAAKLKRRTVSIRAGQLAILAGVALLTTGKWLMGPSIARINSSRAETSVASQLRATHRAAPEVLTGTVMSFQSEADLALEIAARRLVAYHKGE